MLHALVLFLLRVLQAHLGLPAVRLLLEEKRRHGELEQAGHVLLRLLQGHALLQPALPGVPQKLVHAEVLRQQLHHGPVRALLGPVSTNNSTTKHLWAKHTTGRCSFCCCVIASCNFFFAFRRVQRQHPHRGERAQRRGRARGRGGGGRGGGGARGGRAGPGGRHGALRTEEERPAPSWRAAPGGVTPRPRPHDQMT